jgi:hypothetical protein
MSIKVNTYQLQSKSQYAASIALQLREKVNEVNSIYYSLDPEIKNRQGIGSSIRSLQQRMENTQRKMYNISRFLTTAADSYNTAETMVAARGERIGAVASKRVGATGEFRVSAGVYAGADTVSKKDVGATQGAAKGVIKDAKIDSALDTLQTALDIVGFIPGLGEVADGLNVAIALCRGDIIGAALSAIGLVPVVGSAIAVPLKSLLRAAGNADAIRDALKALAAIFGGLDKVVDGLKAVMKAVADLIRGIPDQLASLADNKLLQKALGAEGVGALTAMVIGLRTQVDEVISQCDEMVDSVKKAVGSEGTGKGPYSHLEDPKNVGPGKDFTPAQKNKVIEENRKMNDGVVKSDQSGVEAVKPSKSQKGVTPPDNEWQIDHVVPKDKGGTNSYDNAQVLTRKENREKWNK